MKKNKVTYEKTQDVYGKMQSLYEEIEEMSKCVYENNKVENPIKVSVKDYSNWYSNKIKEYVNLIDEAENRVGVKSVCEKGCCECCKQAIYINPVEYRIISKYIEGLASSKKERLKRQVRSALGVLKKEIPLTFLECSQEEQNHINAVFLVVIYVARFWQRIILVRFMI